jgi:hypothetical protein
MNIKSVEIINFLEMILEFYQLLILKLLVAFFEEKDFLKSLEI